MELGHYTNIDKLCALYIHTLEKDDTITTIPLDMAITSGIPEFTSKGTVITKHKAEVMIQYNGKVYQFSFSEFINKLGLKCED